MGEIVGNGVGLGRGIAEREELLEEIVGRGWHGAMPSRVYFQLY
jgi:hypothetical protein